MSRTRIKICGITHMDDGRAAADAGADAIGFVFAPSKRRVTPILARDILMWVPPFVSIVGVFVNETVERIVQHVVELGLHAVQFHGDESQEYVANLRQVLPPAVAIFQRVRVEPHDGPDTLAERMEETVGIPLLDPGAGDGRPFDWNIASKARESHPRFVLSGGLTHENVAAAIRIARPYAVDVSSGVEASPGRKDADRMRAFVAAVRASDAALG